MDIHSYKLSPKGWAMVGGSAAAAIVFLVVVMHFASAPSYSTLLTGLDPAQTGKITATLDGRGSPTSSRTAAPRSPSSRARPQARVALATAGLLRRSTQPGFALLDSRSSGQ